MISFARFIYVESVYESIDFKRLEKVEPWAEYSVICR